MAPFPIVLSDFLGHWGQYLVYLRHRLWLRLRAGNGRVRQLQKTRGAVLLQRYDRPQSHVHGDHRGDGADLPDLGPRLAGLQPDLGQPHLSVAGHRGRPDHGRRVYRRRVLPRHIAGRRRDRQDRRDVFRARRAVWHVPVWRNRLPFRQLLQFRGERALDRAGPVRSRARA